MEGFGGETRGHQARLREKNTYSLAVGRHPWPVGVLLSLFFITAHVLFYYGQTLMLWSVNATINVSDFHPGCFVKDDFSFSLEENIEVQNFSYTEIISGLWHQQEVNSWANINFDVMISSKLFAVLLTCFSGIWPHAKLLATHWYWYVPSEPVNRTRCLRWLEFFGKWSMLDVFAIVVTVTVFTLSYSNSASGLVDNAVGGAVTFYNKLSDPSPYLEHLVCGGLKNWHSADFPYAPSPSPSKIPYCRAAIDAYPFFKFNTSQSITAVVDIIESSCAAEEWRGNVSIVLQGNTDEGIYYFSTAVWLSLLLSAFINWRDESVLIKEHKNRHVNTQLLETPFISGTEYRDLLEAEHVDENDTRGTKTWDTLYGHAGLPALWNIFVVFLALGGGGLLYVVQLERTVQRDIIGSVSVWLDWFNNQTDSELRTYDMWNTSLQILDGKGTDTFLQKDIFIFTLAGPLVCLLFALLGALLPLPRVVHYGFAKLSMLGFTFSGIEVLMFACIVCTAVLKIQSSGLIDVATASLEFCAANNYLFGYGTTPCFYEQFSLIMPAFLALPALFVVSVVLNWIVHHSTHRVFPTTL